MKMVYMLGVALIGAATAGFVVTRVRKHRAAGAEPSPATSVSSAPRQSNPADTQVLGGKVIETIDVPGYTYLHLDTGSGQIWAAVPASQVKKGSSVTLANAMKMEHFRSKTLKRTFDVIYFGTLATGAAGANLPPGHLGAGNAKPLAGGAQDTLPQGHPPVGPTDSTPIAIPKVDKAKGKNAERISDILAKRGHFAGKLIRVRGVVVKVTPGIKGKTFLHLRDGTGDAAKHDNDLVVTTQAVPEKGAVITLEGTLQTNVDIGIGYHYPALLEDAKVVSK